MTVQSKVKAFLRCAFMLGQTPQERVRILWVLSKNVRAQAYLAPYHPERAYKLGTILRDIYLRDNVGDVTNLSPLFVEHAYRVTYPASLGEIPANAAMVPIEGQIVKLDTYADEQGIGESAFLKVDTEGMEGESSEGAPYVLARTHRIALETHGEARHRSSLNCLQGAGFGIESEKRTGRTGMMWASHPNSKEYRL